MRKSLLFLSLAVAGSVWAGAPKTLQQAECCQVERPVSVKTIASGNGLRVNQLTMPDGSVRRVVVGKNLKVSERAGVSNVSASAKSSRAKVRAKAEGESSVRFSEDFQGYLTEIDPQWSWLPSGWVRKCDDVNKHDAVLDPKDNIFCWKVWSQASDVSMRVQFSMGTDEHAFEQDEWLITPEFTPAEYDLLKFSLSYSPAFTLLDMNTMAFTGWNTHPEVLVSTDDGATWDKIWDCKEHAQSFSEDELWDDAMSMAHPFYDFRVDLSKYTGKKIKIAFRHVGENGESIELDNVEVSLPVVEGLYDVPAGTFYWGFNEKLQRYNPEVGALAPTFAPAVFTNYSSADVTEISWSCFSTDFATNLNGSDRDFTILPKGFEAFYMPFLTVKAPGAQDGLYSKDGAGGTMMPIFFGGDFEKGYRAMYDDEPLAMMLMMFDYSTGGLGNYGITGKGADIDETLKAVFSLDDAKSTSVGFVLPTSPKPYHFTKMMFVLGDIDADDDAVYKLEIFPLVDGVIADMPMATSTVTASQINKVGQLGSLTFKFKGADVNGKEIDYVSYSGDAYVRLSMDDERIRSTTVLTQSVPNAVPRSSSYFEVSSGDKLYIYPLSMLAAGGSNLYIDYAVNMDIAYSWMEPAGDAAEAGTVFETDNQAAEKAYDIDAYYGTDKWSVYYAPEWVSYEFKAADGDAAPQFVLKVAENTGDARKASVLLASPGAQLQFDIRQGAGSGVLDAAIAADNSLPVRFFNLNGVEVNANALVPGVYIRRQGAVATKVVVR